MTHAERQLAFIQGILFAADAENHTTVSISRIQQILDIEKQDDLSEAVSEMERQIMEKKHESISNH